MTLPLTVCDWVCAHVTRWSNTASWSVVSCINSRVQLHDVSILTKENISEPLISQYAIYLSWKCKTETALLWRDCTLPIDSSCTLLQTCNFSKVYSVHKKKITYYYTIENLIPCKAISRSMGALGKFVQSLVVERRMMENMAVMAVPYRA